MVLYRDQLAGRITWQWRFIRAASWSKIYMLLTKKYPTFHIDLGEFEIQAVLENCLPSIMLLVEYLISVHK